MLFTFTMIDLVPQGTGTIDCQFGTLHISDNRCESSLASSFDSKAHSKTLAALQCWKTCKYG